MPLCLFQIEKNMRIGILAISRLMINGGSKYE